MAKPEDAKPIHQRLRFDWNGVAFQRLTQMHEAGRYSVIDADGGKWIVTGGNSNRWPWKIEGQGKGIARNLVEAAEWIAAYRKRHPLSPYKAK